MGNAVIEVLTKEAESEPPAQSEGEVVKKVEVEQEPDGTTKEVETVKEDEKTEEKKEDTASLSAITWGKWCDEFAENNEGIRCSSKSESDTFVKAKKLFKAGFSKDEIMDMVKSGLQIIGVSSKTEEVKLSATKDNKPDFKAISDMFRE